MDYRVWTMDFSYLRPNVIRYLQRADIDTTKWDSLIAGAYTPVPYGYSWYLNVVSPGWGALVKGDYEAVFALTGRSKMGIHYLYQPFFTQQLGIFSRRQPDAKETLGFLNAIPAKYQYLDIYLNSDNLIKDAAYPLTARVNLLLDLSNNYEDIRKGYTDNLKRNIKRGEKNLLTVTEGTDHAKAIAFFRKHTGDKVENLPAAAYDTLEALSRELKARQMLKVFETAMPDGQVVATGLFIHSGNRLINLLPSASEKGKEAGASAFMLHHIIRRHAATDMLLDFEGSMIPGVAQFYRSFGAAEQPYWHLKINRLPWYLKLLKQ